MASWSEASAKFSTWKKSMTLLNVTSGLARQPQRLVGTIIGSHESVLLFSVASSRQTVEWDLSEASFLIEEDRVEVERDGEDPLILEKPPVF